MQLPLLLDRSAAESLTDQIAGQLRQAIVSAQLAGGVRLPSSRRLAEQLEVARNTVMRAYDTLMAEGWVEIAASLGTVVAASEPAMAARAEPSPASAPGRPSWSMPLPALPNPPAAPAAHRRGRLSHDFAPFRAHPALFPLKAWRRLLLKQLARGGSVGLTEAAESGPARFALGDRGAPCDHPRTCGGSRAHSRHVRRPGGRRPRGAPFPAPRHDRGNREPLPGERGDGLRGDRLRARRRRGRRRRACLPTAFRSARPPFSISRRRTSFRPAMCSLRPNGARPSPPGRGAAAAPLSRTISMASSGSKAHRSRRSRRPLRIARSTSGPLRGRSARASSSASWSCRRGLSRRAHWPSACSTAAASGSSRPRSRR